jgi:type II secretory pathway pseudopilin PulG
MNALTILIDMYLAGQAQRGKRGRQGNSNLEAGYAMAALLVGIAIMTVMMTVAMPAWRQMVQREKEEELVFRGEQIAHSIGMFQKKFASAYPPSIDVLVEQKFLRKKYKDPVTNEDFVPLTQAQQQSTTPGGQAGGPTGGRGAQPAQPAQGQRGGPAPGAGPLGLVSSGSPGGAPAGGIIGVTSKSTATSIRLYKGRSHYNEWAFVYTPPPAAAGTATPGAGQRGNNPGQRGTNPNGPFPPGGGGGPFPPGGGQRGGPGGPGGRGPGGNPNPGGTPFPFPPGPAGPGRGR